jgi:hypothetical protein
MKGKMFRTKIWGGKKGTRFTPMTLSVSFAFFEIAESDFYAPRNFGLILPGLGHSAYFVLFVRTHQELEFPILKSRDITA